MRNKIKYGFKTNKNRNKNKNNRSNNFDNINNNFQVTKIIQSSKNTENNNSIYFNIKYYNMS